MNAQERVRARFRFHCLTEVYSDRDISYGGLFGGKLRYNAGCVFLEVVDASQAGHDGFVEVWAYSVDPRLLSKRDRMKVAQECCALDLKSIARRDKHLAWLKYCEIVSLAIPCRQFSARAIALFDPTWYDSQVEITRARRDLAGGRPAYETWDDPMCQFVKGHGYAAIRRAVDAAAVAADLAWELE